MPVDTPQDQPKKFDIRSHDTAEDKRQELLRLFPEVRTEGGKLDFERLKAVLGETIDVGRERYGMNWPGKADCMKTIQAPSMGTLLPCPEESVNWDATENLIIEGDNLEALKLLQKSYLGKVKMIYIDPPYNTGNDFIYPDNYSESLQTYLEYTGQTDSEGRKFGTNSDSEGRFHSKWMNMMYPRLYIARQLLRNDGVIFISIDDNEQKHLRFLGDDIFGEENFVGVFPWRRSTGANDSKEFNRCINHEYLIAYAKTNEFSFTGIVKRFENYSNPDKDPRGPWTRGDLTCNKTASERPNLFYPITDPETGIEYPCSPNNVWRFQRETMLEHIRNRKVLFPKSGTGTPGYKRHQAEVRSESKPLATWTSTASDSNDVEDEAFEWAFPLNTNGTRQLKDLMGGNVFSYPKSPELVKQLLSQSVSPEDIVLDFFAGSGTTGHAVMEWSASTGVCCHFILVQLPEPLESDSEGYKMGFRTIAEVLEERIRRVAKKVGDKVQSDLFVKPAKLDRGFRVFRLKESNFQSWNAEVPHDEQALGTQLSMHIDHIREGRSTNDLLYEILLKSGFPLTTPVQPLEIAGETVYSVAEGSLIVCLERELSLELIRGIAELKPERVVCLDAGFDGNDQLKTNAVQTFRTRGVTSFKTI